MTKMHFFTISILLIFLSSLAGTQCSQKKQVPVIVIFSSEGSKFIRDGKQMPLKKGMLLKSDDTLITDREAVDLQTGTGTLLRVQKFTTVQLSEIGQNTRIKMQQGSLMAKVNKNDSASSFEVQTPTLIAGVRGTTFTVDESGVRVVEGKVAIKPNSAILDDTGISEAQKQAVAKALDSQEKVVEAGQSATMGEQYNTMMEDLKKKVASNETIDDQTIEPSTQLIQINPNETSFKDKAEEATLVGISDELFIRSVEGSPAQSDSLAKEITEQYETKRDLALDVLEKDTLAAIKMDTDEDIKKHYLVIEKVYTFNNEVYVGAVLAQAGGILVVHSRKGMRRVPVKQVDYIDYF